MPADPANCMLEGACDPGTNECLDPVVQPDCCGNGACDGTEDCHTCSRDCGEIPLPPATCGNGICETGDNESCLTCPQDCPGITGGKKSKRYCCGTTDSCDANGICHGSPCNPTPLAGATACCGDGTCVEGVEDASNCPKDC